MTADEIREHVNRLVEWENNGHPNGKPFNFEAAKTGALWEIAAQLAELNHNLSPAAKVEAEKLTAQIKGHF